MATITNTLRYKLVCSGYGERVVTPLGESSFRVNYELNDKPNDPRFGYDLTFTGNLVFIGEDYGWLLGAEEGGYRCTDMFLELESNGCGEGWEEILTGTKVKLSQGNWDLDRCQVTLPVINTDPYECINEKKGDDLDMFMVAGDTVSVRLYDYEPVFEYNYSELNGEPTDIDAQNFEHYPNRKAEYPGFGCEGEIEDPYFPQSDTTLFITDQLNELVRNAVTFNEVLSTGSTPYHSDYPTFSGAFDAIAAGWRLYFYAYYISSIEGATFGLKFDGYYRWVREIKDVTIGTVMPDDWVYVGVVGGLDRWARPPVLSPRKRINKPVFKFTPPAGSERNRIILEGSNYIVGADTNIIDLYDDNGGGVGNGNVYGIKSIPNGKLLNDVIEYAVNAACPDLTVKSEFFQINPTTVTSTNYVTGAATFVDKIILFQKSDVKRPFASSQATVGIFTLKELLNWLLVQFQVKYCIFGTTLRLEHVSSPLYKKPATINLTVPPYSDMIRGYNRYTYDTGGLAARAAFKFMEERKQILFLPDDDFAGLPINYDGSCVNRKDNESVIEYNAGRLTNDVIYILTNSGGYEAQVTDNNTSNKYVVVEDNDRRQIANDGFTMMASKIVSGTRYGITATSILNDRNYINNVLGFALLHHAFWRDEANAETGTINGSAVTFDTTRPIKKQVQLPFKMCCITGFDPYEAIVSEMGTGIVKAAEWSPFDSVMKVELMYRL